MTTWRYIAQNLVTSEFFDWDLPLRQVEIEDVLSGPVRLSASVEPVEPRLIVDGRPLLQRWGTAIWAEAGGKIRGGGILTGGGFNGPSWSLECSGYSAYPQGMPFVDEFKGVDVDPLDLYRLLWAHLQAQPNGNLGLVVDPTISPVRIGTAEELPQFQTGLGEVVRFEEGPIIYAPWVTTDIGSEMDKLATDTPFDYHEVHDWDGEVIAHRMEVGYPSLGRRREDLRFVLGENVTVTPNIEQEIEDYVNGVQVLGAGQGREMIRATTLNPDADGRLRRIATISDKSLRSPQEAGTRAAQELARRRPVPVISELTVIDHEHAPLESWRAGDEIPIDGRADWGEFHLWGRVVSTRITPEAPSMATITIVRPDREVL